MSNDEQDQRSQVHEYGQFTSVRALSFVIPFLVALLLAALGCSDNRSFDPPQLVRRGRIVFVNDSTTGYELARQSNRPCLLFFTAEWCTFCHEMEATAFADPVVGKLAENFVCVLIDADREPKVCRQFAIRGYPTVQFLAADGRRLHRLVGRQPAPKLAAGMQAALERLAWLDNGLVGRNKR